MSFIGVINFTKFSLDNSKLIVNDFLHENTPSIWTTGHCALFQNLRKALTSDTEFTNPNTKQSFSLQSMLP